MSTVIVIPIENIIIRVLIFIDNAGALVWAKTLSPKFTSWSKHDHMKTTYFQDDIMKCGVRLLKILIIEQLGYSFTKRLRTNKTRV